MDMNVENTVRKVHEGSDSESMAFPAVIAALIAAGVERYTCDLVLAERTYYLPDGGGYRFASRRHARGAAAAFSPGGVEAAVRRSQAGKIRYGEFCDEVLAAGCVGYIVSIVGRRAVYFGRSGETFVEPFPGAK